MRPRSRLASLLDGAAGRGLSGGVLGGVVPTAAGPIHYLADGPEAPLPVILLHGANANLRDWSSSLLPMLARRMPVIAMDRPGFGHSLPVDGPVWLLERQVAALRSVALALGHRRYLLLGHSFGGAVALDWALRHPDEVAGLCVLSGAAMDWGGELPRYYRLAGMPVLGAALSQLAPLLATDDRIDAALAMVFAPQPVPRGYRETAGVRLALRPSTLRIDARAMRLLHQQIKANQPLYGRVTCPVEVVHGAEDKILAPEVHAEPLSRALPDALLSLLPGIGHMPHHAAPDAVLTAIGRLRERVTARQAQQPQTAQQDEEAKGT